MTEPYFGAVTASPFWSGIAPAFGFFPTPLGTGIAHGSEGFGSPNIPPAAIAGLPAVGPGFQTAGAMPGFPHPAYAGSPQPYGLGGGPQPYGFGGGLMPPVATGPLFGQLGPGSAPGQGSFGASYSGLGGFELPPGITAPAIMAAIAMRRGQPQGPANDQEIEEFIYDALELLPGTNDVEVRVEGGRVTLTGSVQQKRLKHDGGEIAWAIPSVNDVVNNVNIATRRRSRAAGREGESQQPGAAARKQG